MNIEFYKYHGTGNDFILIDNRYQMLREITPNFVQKLCARRFGIGADGLMVVYNHPEYDFSMEYFNSDGSGGTMCGNGGRCIVAFAKHLGLVSETAKFTASDGLHLAEIDETNRVKLQMIDVKNIERNSEYFFIYTGSPHYVKFVTGLGNFDVFNQGRSIRYSEKFKEKGTNVNFVEILDNEIFVRTYERGVEDETYSCGTGVTASAIAYSLLTQNSVQPVHIRTLGGNLKVHFEKHNDNFTNVWLEGPTCQVFKGELNWNNE